MTEYERFGLVFTKTRVYKFGHWIHNSGSRKILLGVGNVAKKEDFDLKSSRKEANLFLTFYSQLFSTWLSSLGPCCELKNGSLKDPKRNPNAVPVPLYCIVCQFEFETTKLSCIIDI
jgi:hypothetical protein